MKNSLLIFSLLVALASSSCSKGVATDVKLKSKTDSASYFIGRLIGSNVEKYYTQQPNSSKLNKEIFLSGIVKSIQDTAKFDEAKMDAFLQTYMQEAMAEAAKENIEKGNKFLEENKKKDGVVTTASGLQYKFITKGTGAMPTAESTVKCHYAGTMIDGKEFDSSYKRGEPATFPVTGVIPGWTEVLQLMPVGSKVEVVIPSALGYGERGSQSIPGNSVLKFEIELLDIEAPQN